MKHGRAASILVGVAAVVALAAWALRDRKTHDAVEACRSAVRAEGERLEARWLARARGGAEDQAEPEPDSDVIVVCAPLYRAPECNVAMAQAKGSASPGDRYRRIVDACRDAYCPSLPSPRPLLCDERPKGRRELADAWLNLSDAILRHELGEEAESLVGARREARDRVSRAMATYVEAGSPAFTGSRGSVRVRPAEDGGDAGDAGDAAP